MAGNLDDPNFAKLLIENKANVNAKFHGDHDVSKGNTALIWASKRGNLKIAKLLIANKADVNAIRLSLFRF